MVDPHTNGCPDPEVLAAYVDRGLSLAERARVDVHLASCPQCIRAVAGVVRTVAELSVQMPDVVTIPEATPLVTRRSLAGVLTAAAAVLAILAAPSILKPWLDRDAGLVSLVDSVGEHRSVLGRLTGGFPHAPLGVPSAGGQDGRAAGTDRVLLTAGKTRESFDNVTTPSQLHAAGVAQLLEGRYDEAAQSLLAASREQPANARYLNDVATVQLERARLGLRPDDLPRALAAADRARRLDPSLPEAWFNHALAASALSLRAEARTGWTEYLKRDSSSAWAAEARMHLDDLAKPTAAAAWEAMEGRLKERIDAATAEDAVRTQATEARRFVHNSLVPAWAAAVLNGSNAQVELESIRLMADATLRVTSDALYRDAVAAIERAAAAGQSAQLARAHQQFTAAAAQFEEDRFAAAVPAMTAARAQFDGLDSPFAALADADLGAINYVSGNYPAAEELLAATQAVAESKGYSYVAARASWFRGLIAFAQGRIADAQAHYEYTLATFERMGDVEQRAGAHSLLAALNFYLGDKVAEWQHRQVSLEAIPVSRSPRFMHAILASAAASMRVDAPEAALAMQDAVLANARQWGREAAIADGLAQRSATLVSLGRNDEATKALDEAKANLRRVTDESFRAIFELPILAVESDLSRNHDPATAVQAAARGLQFVQARGDRPRVAQFALRLAKANIVWGKLDEAEVALATGMQAFDAERASLTDEGRLSTADESWQLFDTAVQLAIRRGDHARAFAMAERARARSLTEQRLAAGGPSLSEAQRLLAPGEVAVALNQFDDELAVWAITPTSVRVAIRPLTRSAATHLLSRQQLEIATGSAAPKFNAILYDEIIRPLERELRAATKVTVVPDATFQDASFAALWNRPRNRYFAEETTLSASPSFWAMTRMGQDSVSRSNDALVLSLGQDSAASAEVIANTYRQHEWLQDGNATRSRFLANAAKSGVVHLAAPSRRNDTFPLLSGVILADEPGRRHTGRLLARDVAAQSLSRTSLVVLDEVETGSGNRGEGTLSMARAFLAAGVSAVVGTLPGADENAARDLMIGFHREVAQGAPAARALSTVQRNAIQQNGRRLGAWTALVLYGSSR